MRVFDDAPPKAGIHRLARDGASRRCMGAHVSCRRKRQASGFGANTMVSGDVDGNGKADFQILLYGQVTLLATDFVL
jgi:hypothetical protein